MTFGDLNVNHIKLITTVIVLYNKSRRPESWPTKADKWSLISVEGAINIQPSHLSTPTYKFNMGGGGDPKSSGQMTGTAKKQRVAGIILPPN